MNKAEPMPPMVSADILEPAQRTTARRAEMPRKRDWWKRTSVYQIYPLSFQDSERDGMGDIPGILSRLDHLSPLGIGTVWLSPVYPSPMADFGYDIADFTDIDPRFGTLSDFDAPVEALHGRDIRLARCGGSDARLVLRSDEGVIVELVGTPIRSEGIS